MEERINNVKQCAEERSQLQQTCFELIDLENLNKPKEVALSRYAYDNCVKENLKNYSCLSRREEILYSPNI